MLRIEIEDRCEVTSPLESVARLDGGRGGGGGGGDEMGEVKVRVGAVESSGSLIVCHGSLLGGGEGAKPEAGALLGLADLCDPFPPGALADAAVLARGVLRAPLAAGRALLPRPHRRGFSHVVHILDSREETREYV